MRKVNSKIEDIISQIQSLKGKDVELEITKGRKKTIKYSGKIECVYPSIFTVRSYEGDGKNAFSYSYSEVLCGDVSLMAQEKMQG